MARRKTREAPKSLAEITHHDLTDIILPIEVNAIYLEIIQSLRRNPHIKHTLVRYGGETYTFELFNGAIKDDAAAQHLAEYLARVTTRNPIAEINNIPNPFLLFGNRIELWNELLPVANEIKLAEALHYLLSLPPLVIDVDGVAVYRSRVIDMEIPSLVECDELAVIKAYIEFFTKSERLDPIAMPKELLSHFCRAAGVGHLFETILFESRISKYLDQIYKDHLPSEVDVETIDLNQLQALRKSLEMESPDWLDELVEKMYGDEARSQGRQITSSGIFLYHAAVINILKELFDSKFLTTVGPHVDALAKTYDIPDSRKRVVHYDLDAIVRKFLNQKLDAVKTLIGEERRVELMRLKKIATLLNDAFQHEFGIDLIDQESMLRIVEPLNDSIVLETLQFTFQTTDENLIKSRVEILYETFLRYVDDTDEARADFADLVNQTFRLKLSKARTMRSDDKKAQIISLIEIYNDLNDEFALYYPDGIITDPGQLFSFGFDTGRPDSTPRPLIDS